MPGKIRAKQRTSKGLQYDTLETLGFNVIKSAAATQANTTVQDAIPLACAFKIAYVAIYVQSTGTGTTKFNIVLDSNAEGSVGTPDNFDTTGTITTAVGGTVLFSSDQTVSNVVGTYLFSAGASGEVIWPSGHALTLRTAGTTLTYALNVEVYGTWVDVNQSSPATDTTAGGLPHTYTFGTDPL